MKPDMKQTAIIVFTMLISLTAGAQTMQDAINFSEYNYEGTARTIAMGNAFTAIGGDLGSININPAGSAVAPYSQVTVTPGVYISSNKAAGLSFNGQSNGFQHINKRTKTTGGIPNIGFTVNFNTNNNRRLKNVTIGFTANRSNSYRDAALASGRNSHTSLTGAMAVAANGFNINDLLDKNAWDNPNLDFGAILAAQSGLIENLTGDRPTEYVGITEHLHLGPDGRPMLDDDGNVIIEQVPVDQIYSRMINGSKMDYVFNVGFNISNIVYIGANFGVISLDYEFEETQIERAENPMVFQSRFKQLKHTYCYNTSGSGFYGKFGVIVTPISGLRIGAAIQTPTAFRLHDYYFTEASSEFVDKPKDASASTPDGEYRYRLSSPFRFNAGLAYVFGRSVLLSADYEYSNYRHMKFTGQYVTDGSEFENVNNEIKDLAGVQHSFRAGLEVKPVQGFALRAGYGFSTSPEKHFEGESITADSKAVYSGTDSWSHRFSFGLGYDEGGYFFGDLGCSARQNTDYIIPYADYAAIPSPTIQNKRWLWTVALTIGVRF